MPLMLETKNVTAGYANRQVLHDVSLHVEKRERLLLIGPNGSGKSTLLKVLAGVLYPETGTVTLKGKAVTKCPTDTRIRMGMGYLKQTRNTFSGYRLKAGQFPLLWLYSSWAYPRIVESIILSR
jgi:ABC-type branched-subunit amino acid transport system ATPase component